MQTESFEDPGSAVDRVTRADDQFIALSNNGKFDELRTLLAEDFTYVNHYGSIFDRDAFISLLASYKTVATLQPGKSRTINIFANSVAVVHGLVEVQYQPPAKSKVGLSAYSRVWMNQDGRWVSISLHASDARLMESWEKLLASSRVDS